MMNFRQTCAKELNRLNQMKYRQKNVDTFSRVQKFLAEKLGVATYEIQLNSNIVEDLGADSLDFVELIVAFEDEFKIENRLVCGRRIYH